jgi:hypothetical protein
MMLKSAFLLILITAGRALAADPFVGTWKPSLEEWKLSPGAPEREKNVSLKWEPAGADIYRITSYAPDGQVVSFDGKMPAAPVEYFFDGKEHQQGGLLVTGRRIDPRHLKASVKGARGTAIEEFIVSPDGNTLRFVRTGTGSNSGRPLDEVLVYHRK